MKEINTFLELLGTKIVHEIVSPEILYTCTCRFGCYGLYRYGLQYFVWVKVVRVHVFILMSFKVVSFRDFVFRENVVLLSLLSLTNFIKVKDAKLFIINFSIHCVKKPL